MPLAPSLIMLAIYGQVILTFILLFLMASRRIRALKEGKATMEAVSLNAMAWPDDAIKAANAFKNQFELPVLFYIVSVLFVGFTRPDLIVAALAIVFVITRYVHAFIHINSNNVKNRFYAFFAGVACVALMWGYLLFSHIMLWIRVVG